MSWLRTTLDEVAHFHPAFEEVANETLSLAGLDAEYEWVHHIRVPGNTVVPDFVLRRRNGGQWIVAVELKRTKEAVYSTRYQLQAKSYAEINQVLYPPNRPKYFVISNLEVTLLFALNGNRPPLECQLENGVYESGNFHLDTADVHRAGFRQTLNEICNRVLSETRPAFEQVWPAVLHDFAAFANAEGIMELATHQPATPNWHLVRDYFGAAQAVDGQRIFFLRAMLAEYLRGILLKVQHPQAGRLPPLNAQTQQRSMLSVANLIDGLRSIDFSGVFEDDASGAYRSMTNATVRGLMEEYVRRLITPPRRLVDLVSSRVDALVLPDLLLDSFQSATSRDESGKVPTDPELAALLATFTITGIDQRVLDPCCGEGALLSAGYERLTQLGSSVQQALSLLDGIEADGLSVRIAHLRLALKEPAILSPDQSIRVLQGDMFAHAEMFRQADVILMNPPFKRYEAQDGRPVPAELRSYFGDAIHSLDGRAAQTVNRQANLYHYYIEFLAKTVRAGTRIGLILDNKWYQSQYGKALRQLFLDEFVIEGIIEYPHGIFFTGWTIATSIVILVKVDTVTPEQSVRFIRSKVDPRGVDLQQIADAFARRGDWPVDWICNEKLQSELKAAEGWKSNFSSELQIDYRAGLPALPELFEETRRGSLNKEEGGVGVLEFPFERGNYGKRRLPVAKGRSFQTGEGDPLSAEQNQELRLLSSRIPQSFRGWALKNADDIEGYVIQESSLLAQQVLEPPSLRQSPAHHGMSRVAWSGAMDQAVEEMRSDPEVGAFLIKFEEYTNLRESTLSLDKIWVGLREPYAGELIIPRKTRSGHRVHFNPYALQTAGRQLRLSSNFITFKNCIAIDQTNGLDRGTAAKLIVSFLVSSFGQLQFEREGYNREGMLAVEAAQLARIKIFDPRWVRPDKRAEILNAFDQLPYPVPTDQYSFSQTTRNELDKLFAEEFHALFQMDPKRLLEEVHLLLDDWLMGRNP